MVWSNPIKMPDSAPSSSKLIKPLLCWLAINLAALGLGAAGVSLSAKPFTPPEAGSLAIVAVAQVAMAALLWPVLFESGWGAVGVIFTAAPFLQAGAFLSATPANLFLTTIAVVYVWLLTLAVLPVMKSGSMYVTVARVCVILWCFGGALCCYFRAEFSIGVRPLPLGPIVQILSALPSETATSHFLFAGGWLVVAIIIRVLATKRSRTSAL